MKAEPHAALANDSRRARPVGCVHRHPSGPKPIELIATRGPLDLDNPQPAITFMLPGEEGANNVLPCCQPVVASR
jgi:hypothetical protein